MGQPLISIAMPVYNAGHFLQVAINSIINQTYQNWELLIIDDGSTDGCCDSVLLLNDARIKLIKDGVNRGLAIRLNQCIEIANGSYIARMDQDDIAFPKRLETHWIFLEENPKVDLVSSYALTFIENKLVGHLPYRKAHQQICAAPWNGFYMPHPTWMGKSEWFKKYKYQVPEVKLAEDQELLLRSYNESTFASTPEPLLAYQLRKNVRFSVTFKARSHLLLVQWVLFSKRGQLGNLILSTLTFLAKITFDFFATMGWLKHKKFKNEVSSAELNAWQNLSASVGLNIE
jgi:glycosyltransferase involved in cell wall biosynthesis